MADLDAFLLDHATCERKAAASALSLLHAFPERHELVLSMFELAQEEIGHERAVYEELHRRGARMGPAGKDEYVGHLMKLVRGTGDDYFLDRLLVFGVIEARSCERLGLVADALPPGPLKDLYWDLTRAEARHHGLFVRLSKKYFEAHVVEERLHELLTAEAAIVASLPHRAAVH